MGISSMAHRILDPLGDEPKLRVDIGEVVLGGTLCRGRQLRGGGRQTWRRAVAQQHHGRQLARVQRQRGLQAPRRRRATAHIRVSHGHCVRDHYGQSDWRLTCPGCRCGTGPAGPWRRCGCCASALAGYPGGWWSFPPGAARCCSPSAPALASTAASPPRTSLVVSCCNRYWLEFRPYRQFALQI